MSRKEPLTEEELPYYLENNGHSEIPLLLEEEEIGFDKEINVRLDEDITEHFISFLENEFSDICENVKNENEENDPNEESFAIEPDNLRIENSHSFQDKLKAFEEDMNNASAQRIYESFILEELFQQMCDKTNVYPVLEDIY